MATAKPAKKKAPREDLADTEFDIWDLGSQYMRRYGEEVNEDRAIAALEDGLKPVTRRLIYQGRSAALRQGKSARLVGNVMGALHPHGDSGIYGGLTTAVNAPVPPFVGIGNWGSMTDNAAAMRYTEMYLSTYGKQFVVPDYMAITPMTANYDDKEMEPVYLPSLLPNIFLNDTDGIGYGVKAGLPAFTPVSLLKILLRMLNKEKLEPKDFAKELVLYEPWGGVPVPTKANRANILALMENEGASVTYHSPLTVEKDAKRIIVDRFGPRLNHDTFVNSCRSIPQVKSVYSGKGLSYVIQVHSNVNMNEFDAVCEKVRKLSETKMSYKMFVSSRSLVQKTEDKAEVKVEFFAGSVPQILLKWLKHRIQLEAKCLQYRIDETDKVIKRLKLLIHACDHLDVIFKALRTENPAQHIAKGLKISLEDANVILSLRVRQLSKLDKESVQKKLKLMEQRRGILAKQLERPARNVKKYFEHCLELFIQRPREEGTPSRCLQWWLKSNPVTDDTHQLLAAGTSSDEPEETTE